MFRLKYSVLLSMAVAVNFAGCGGGEPSDRPGRAPVTVTVKHNGTAVEAATVTFHPKSEEGKGAYGITDSSGQVQLTTFPDTPGDGVIPGEYTVTVQKSEGASSDGVFGDAEESDEGSDEEGGEEAPESKDLLPEKYKDPTTTDLSATVPEGGKDFEFNLED
jgi:hypothetical protein